MSSFGLFGRILVVGGIFIVLLGLLLLFWNRIPFLGKLPGDIYLEKGNFRFFAPIVTMLVLSVVLTIVVNLVLWLLRR